MSTTAPFSLATLALPTGKTLTAAMLPRRFEIGATTLAAVKVAAQGSQAATLPTEPLGRPLYDKAVTTATGQLAAVEKVRDTFTNVRLDIQRLRRFGDTAGDNARSLIDRVQDYLDDHLTEAELKRLKLAAGPADAGRFRTALLPELFKDAASPLQRKAFAAELAALPDTPRKDGSRHNHESALFSAGAALAEDIRLIEALRHGLVTLRRHHQEALDAARAELAALDTRLPDEMAQLDVLEHSRAEALDDYALAQRLLAEHWQAVEARHVERARVIDGHQGLFYVKVRQTPLGRTLPDPLELRPSAADDLVPGCSGRDTPLPAALAPFMDMVLDLPLDDWRALRPLGHLLPDRERLTSLVEDRRQKLVLRASRTVSAAALGAVAGHPVLTGLLRQHQGVVQQLAARPFASATAASLATLQQQGHAILGLDDLLANAAPRLREPARALHQRLDAAAGCLLARLRAVAPSLRLAWSAAAEADRLPVESPERWPDIASAENQDFNGTRTLVELVAWWFRQLDDDASAEARTTMRHLVRACVLLAAGDDPQQLLQGRLQTIPGRALRPGERLRLDLNREPARGALLHLLDPEQRVIALLHIDDHDAQGSVASVARVIDAAAMVSTRLQVSGAGTSPDGTP